MRGELDEIELIMETYEDKVNIILQIDKKARGLLANLADSLDLDERHVFFTFNYNQISTPEQVGAVSKDIIEREYNKIAW